MANQTRVSDLESDREESECDLSCEFCSSDEEDEPLPQTDYFKETQIKSKISSF